LLNLVRNAREAMTTGGRLRVTVDVPAVAAPALADSTAGAVAALVMPLSAAPALASVPAADAAPEPGGRRVVRLRLSDSGPGIPEADRSKIFDPFFSTKDKGTGLGLALVQQIVAEHGARIEVESVVGQGTTLTLIFPALSPGAADMLAQRPTASPPPETAGALNKALA
jgi:signal transduction histidine kinase